MDPHNTEISSEDHFLLAILGLTSVKNDVILKPKQIFELKVLSSSRFTESSCRSNLIINFDTSRQFRSNVLGSTFIHFRSKCRIDTRDNVEFDVRCGLAFATSFVKFLSNTFNVSFFRHLRHVVCFHESILSLEMMDHFEAKCVTGDHLFVISATCSVLPCFVVSDSHKPLSLCRY